MRIGSSRKEEDEEGILIQALLDFGIKKGGEKTETEIGEEERAEFSLISQQQQFYLNGVVIYSPYSTLESHVFLADWLLNSRASNCSN